MFSSTRLNIFVCLALGLVAGAAPAGTPAVNIITKRDSYDLSGGLISLILGAEGHGSNSNEDTYILKRQLAGLDIGSRLDSNTGIQHAALLAEAGPGLGSSVGTDDTVAKRDTYDFSGGLASLILGAEGRGGSNSNEDTYILKRQLAGLDIGSRLGSNIGLEHAALLGEAGLALGNSVGTKDTTAKRDTYDLSDGLIGLFLGAEGYGGGDSDEDTYILKREYAEVQARSPDVYDLTGGLGALIFGSEGYGGNSDEDVYILKRQLEGLQPLSSVLNENAGSLLSDNAGSTSTHTSANAFGGNADLASSLGLGL